MILGVAKPTDHRELERRYADLSTLRTLLSGKLEAFGKTGSVPGICPLCPYPEADEPLAEVKPRGRTGRRGGVAPAAPGK